MPNMIDRLPQTLATLQQSMRLRDRKLAINDLRAYGRLEWVLATNTLLAKWYGFSAAVAGAWRAVAFRVAKAAINIRAAVAAARFSKYDLDLGRGPGPHGEDVSEDELVERVARVRAARFDGDGQLLPPNSPLRLPRETFRCRDCGGSFATRQASAICPHCAVTGCASHSAAGKIYRCLREGGPATSAAIAISVGLAHPLVRATLHRRAGSLFVRHGNTWAATERVDLTTEPAGLQPPASEPAVPGPLQPQPYPLAGGDLWRVWCNDCGGPTVARADLIDQPHTCDDCGDPTPP